MFVEGFEENLIGGRRLSFCAHGFHALICQSFLCFVKRETMKVRHLNLCTAFCICGVKGSVGGAKAPERPQGRAIAKEAHELCNRRLETGNKRGEKGNLVKSV